MYDPSTRYVELIQTEAKYKMLINFLAANIMDGGTLDDPYTPIGKYVDQLNLILPALEPEIEW